MRGGCFYRLLWKGPLERGSAGGGRPQGYKHTVPSVSVHSRVTYPCFQNGWCLHLWCREPRSCNQSVHFVRTFLFSCCGHTCAAPDLRHCFIILVVRITIFVHGSGLSQCVCSQCAHRENVAKLGKCLSQLRRAAGLNIDDARRTRLSRTFTMPSERTRRST